MEELNKKLNELILNFRNQKIDFKQAILEFEKLIEEYVKLKNEDINQLNIDAIKVSFMEALDKINKIITVKDNIGTLLSENIKLKISLELI